jgi:hypothetical protein
MTADYVVVRTPSAGTLTGDLVRDHPGSRVTSVPCGPARGGRMDQLALVEGVPLSAVAQLLLAWNLRFGVPAQVLGDPFALRLPIVVPASVHPWKGLLEASEGLTVAGNVVHGDCIEEWIRCTDHAQAQRVIGQLRLAAGSGGAEVMAGTPRPHDLECWEVLHQAVAWEGAELVAVPDQALHRRATSMA